MIDSHLDPFATATAMLQALETRQISAVELLELHLQRIARYNPTLNAIVTPNYDEATRMAASADAARAHGETGALLGLPITIKDCIDVAGLPGTAGIPRWAARRPAEDAPLVRRVRAAGAVILGKTNVPPYAGDWQANNHLFGRTNNPWDLSRTPGGSTGGGAAALAAGLIPLEFGSDIGGSIRLPAAFCGVYGHKPSETALPRSGHFPGAPLPNAATVMAVLGPLARAAEDLELALGLLAGPDVGEDAAWHIALPSARHERLADFRVAVLPTLAWLPVDDEIHAAQEQVVATLQRAGVHVVEAAPEAFDDLREYYKLYLRLLAVMISLGTSQEKRRAQVEEARASGNEFALASAEGLAASAEEYIIWHGMREYYRAVWRSFFQEWDILLMPVDIVPAFPHTDLPWDERWLDVNGQRVAYSMQSAYPAVATLAGHPATSFPVGLSRAGLPIGLQAMGPYLEDYTPLRFAALLAQEIGGFRPPAGYEA